MKSAKILTPTIVALSVVSLFNDISSEMLYPILPVYLGSIGFSALWIGILEGIAEVTAGISKGYFGKLSDTTGNRIGFVRSGYFLSAISKSALGLVTLPILIICVRAMDKLGKGIRTAARDAMLADECTPEHRGKVFGFNKAMDTIGAAIGPAFAIVYLFFFPKHYQEIFLIAFIPAVIGVAITLFIKQRKIIVDKVVGKAGFFSYFGYWKTSSPEYKKLVIALLGFALFNSSDFFLIMIAKQNGMSDTQVIGGYIFYNIVFALLAYPIGKIADKRGMKFSFMIGLCFFILAYSLIPFAKSTTTLAIVFFLYGIYASCNEGISKAWITKLCSPNEKATAIGYYSSMSSIFTMLSSFLAGILWVAAGSSFVFIFSAAGAAIILGFIFRNLK